MSPSIKKQIIDIITLFEKNVLGKSATILNKKGHDGAAGHALEDLFKLRKSRTSNADFGLIEL